ncbi:hypothetical protein LINPERHAP2_LOCUS3738 [Linum perenne]
MQVHKPQVIAILEPRISGSVGKAVRRKLRFNSSFIVEAQGFSEGIWLLWNETDFKIKILGSSHFFIHVQVNWDSGKSCEATFVYASPFIQGRRALWDDLRRISASIAKPWVLMGDFNAIVESSEKSGGANFNQIPAREFHECIQDCNLIDAGFVGPKFTWFRRNMKERLDCCLANADWLALFSDSFVVHLERLKSDHRPILVRLDHPDRYLCKPRLFHFNAAWFGHGNFPDFLDQSWKLGRDLCLSLQDFQDRCISWNANVFGHIFKRKRHLEKRLRQLELRSQNDSSELKVQGGLGLRKARELNQAYLMKLGWEILNNPDKL